MFSSCFGIGKLKSKWLCICFLCIPIWGDLSLYVWISVCECVCVCVYFILNYRVGGDGINMYFFLSCSPKDLEYIDLGCITALFLFQIFINLKRIQLIPPSFPIIPLNEIVHFLTEHFWIFFFWRIYKIQIKSWFNHWFLTRNIKLKANQLLSFLRWSWMYWTLSF